jgi:Na+-transporting methylmalonyl-CoA/oxaloacetate decarboxylase gamma subunit
MIARSLRYYVEAILAIFYGRQVIDFIKEYGFIILAIVLSACVVGLIGYLIKRRLGKETIKSDEADERIEELDKTVERVVDSTTSKNATD